MFVVRKDQMAVLSEYIQREFEDRTAESLRKLYPEKVVAMGDGKLRELIRAGVKKAASYGIQAESDVQRYVELMVKFSPDFDTNAATSWAGEILGLRSIDGPRKMRRLNNTIRKREGGIQ